MMHLSILGLVGLLFIGCISTSLVSTWKDPEILLTMNEYVDEVMVNARILLGQNRPIPLPDLTVPIQNVATLNLTDGGVYGTNTIHRIDNCFIAIEPNGDAVIRVAVGLNEAAIGYFVSLALVEGDPIVIRLRGAITKMDLTLQIRISDDLRIQVDELLLDDIGRVEVKFYDSAFDETIEIVASVLASAIANSAKDPLSEFVSGFLKDLINDALKPTPVPPQFKRLF